MRKSEIVTIPKAKPDENRDQGKIFLLTEMSAARAEKWAARLLLALAAQGMASPGDAQMGMQGLANIGPTDLMAGLRFDVVEPLMDEMMDCVFIVPDPSKKNIETDQPLSRPLVEDDIEEIATRVLLRGKVLDLHTGFSVSAFLSRLGQAAKARISTIPTSLEQ
jgi:hypothetical protein